MSLIVETGAGLSNSNSYATVAEGTTFHTNYGTLSEWIDKCGSASLEFYNQPTVGNTVTIGSTVYTFKSSISVTGDVKIGATLQDSVDNLVAAINWTGQTGIDYIGASADPLASATAADTVITVTAKVGGSSNSTIGVSTTMSLPNKASSSALQGGEDTREQALIRATSYMMSEYRGRWLERRTHQDQALDWPRAYVDDADGFRINSDVVPTKVKNACCLLALSVIRGDALMPDIEASTSGVTAEAIEVGPIKESKSYSGSGASQFKRYTEVDAMLSELLESNRRIFLG